MLLLIEFRARAFSNADVAVALEGAVMLELDPSLFWFVDKEKKGYKYSIQNNSKK
jgi:hypothetical protein